MNRKYIKFPHQINYKKNNAENFLTTEYLFTFIL